MIQYLTPAGAAFGVQKIGTGRAESWSAVRFAQQWRGIFSWRSPLRAGQNTASVVAIGPQRRGITVEHKAKPVLDIARLADRHSRPRWVRTIHSAQGATADRVMAHLESFRAKTVDAPAVYVAISRVRDAVALYTDSRARLTEVLGLRDGAQVGAIDEVQRREVEMAMG